MRRLVFVLVLLTLFTGGRNCAHAAPALPGLEPFDPPALKDLDAKADWEALPVVDSLELLRKLQAKETPTATAAEALALKNDSKAANAKILSALGRLPAKDTDVDWNATINRAIRGDVKSTNPIMQNSVQEFEVVELMGGGLFGFDWDMQPFATKDTVVSWQTSKDRLYDKVVLRDDWTWSDGKPVTAHDVAFSFATIMNPKVEVPAVRSTTDQLKAVIAYDDRTVVFFHKRPLATNVWNVNFPIIPRHVYEPFVKRLADDKVTWTIIQQDPEYVKYDENPVCSGAYIISSRKRRQEIVLARRESYYTHNGKQVRDKPFAKEVRFRVIEDPNTALLALKTGQIDDLELTAEQWQNQTTDNEYYKLNTKATGTEWVYFYFGWNCKSPYFSDPRVRKAMSYAFDHEELEKLNYRLYERCNGMFHPSSWMAPKKPRPFLKQDLDKAEDLLTAAGWTDSDGDGVLDKTINGKKVKFEFTILVSVAPERVRYCNLLRQNLKQVGIDCNVRALEVTVLSQELLEHKFDAYFSGWGTGTDPDTTENIWTTKAITEGRNFVQYSNAEVDKLYDAGKLEFDREKRAAIYAKIDELVFEDQPYTFLYYRNSFYGFDKRLRGYKFSPRGPYTYSPGFSSIWAAAQ